MSRGQDIYVPEVAVASIDVLGMGGLLEADDESRSAMNALALLLRNASGRSMYTNPSTGEGRVDLYEQRTYFGDSVYLFGSRERTLEEQVQHLAIRASSLFVVGLTKAEPPFMLRVGISIGDLRIRKVETEQGIQEIRIGTAMAKAHRLENSQMWIGGAVDPYIELPRNNLFVVEYDVPVQDKSATRPRLALNWLWRDADEAGVIEKLSMASSDTARGPSDDRKLRNSIDFIRFVFQQGFVRPFG